MRHADHSTGRPRNGFTLVETIAAMTLIAALGSVSSFLIYSSVTSYRDAAVKAQLGDELSTGLDRLTRALWSVDRETAAPTPSPQISAITPTSIAWNGNWSLTLTGTQLLLVESGGAAQPILNNVTAFSISGFDEANAALAANLSGTATRAVRRLQIQATIQRQGISETLRTRVFLRCTMSGAATG